MFLWEECLLEELGRRGRADWLPTWEEESPSSLCLVLALLSFNFLDCTFELTMVLGLPRFSSISYGGKIPSRLKYLINFRWPTKMPLGSNPFTVETKPNSHNSNSFATSFIWVEFLTSNNGIWMKWHLRFFSKKEDQNKYYMHTSEMNNPSIKNFGKRKGDSL